MVSVVRNTSRMIDYQVWTSAMVKNKIERITSAATSPGNRQQNSDRSFLTHSHTPPVRRCSDGNEAT